MRDSFYREAINHNGKNISAAPLSVGCNRLAQGERFEGTIHHFFMVWCSKGRIHIKTDGISMGIDEGYVGIVTPPAHYRLSACTAESECCWLAVNGEDIDSFCRLNGFWTGLFSYPVPPLNELEKLGEFIESDGNAEHAKLAKNMMMRIARSVSNDLLRFTPDRKLFTAIRLIHQNVDDCNLGVESLARTMAMHRKSLYAIFKKNMGCSAQDYIKQVRINRICRLMRYITTDLRELAAAAGFSDTAYLSKVLQKHFDKRTSEFRATPRCRHHQCSSLLFKHHEPAKL